MRTRLTPAFTANPPLPGGDRCADGNTAALYVALEVKQLISRIPHSLEFLHTRVKLEQLIAVLKPRRDQHNLAVEAMQRVAALVKAELAKKEDPFEWFEPPQGEVDVPPEQWPAQEAKLVDALLVDGPGTRNRARKREYRAGSEIKAYQREVQRKRCAQIERAAQRRKPRRTARSKAGPPRSDLRRLVLQFLAIIYRKATKKVPRLSERMPTEFQQFVKAYFDAIGLKVPYFRSTDLAWLLSTGNRNNLNKPAARRWLFDEELPEDTQADAHVIEFRAWEKAIAIAQRMRIRRMLAARYDARQTKRIERRLLSFAALSPNRVRVSGMTFRSADVE
jgi:hypothetical protein